MSASSLIDQSVELLTYTSNAPPLSSLETSNLLVDENSLINMEQNQCKMVYYYRRTFQIYMKVNSNENESRPITMRK